MQIQTEQGRTVITGQQEFDLGTTEVKAEIEKWTQRLKAAPGEFPAVEKLIRRQMMQIADLVCAGILAEASADGLTDEQIEEVREKAQQEGNPLKAPMRNYPVKVALLSGLILCLRVVYCPVDKRKRKQLIDENLLPADAPQRGGAHVELTRFGFGKGCSPGLQDELSRLVCFFPSMEQARKELSRRGIEIDIKQLRRIALDAGFGLLDVRRQRVEQLKAGTLPQGEELKGKKVAVAIDGGRVRFRISRKRTKKGMRTEFDLIWKEPKLVIIYIMDEDGRKLTEAPFWIDGTFQKADQAMELVAMHLHRLGAKDALSIEFISDGAPWIWNRLNWVIEKVGIDPNKVTRVLDFWHAAHHISLTLERLGVPDEQRREKFQALRRDLRMGRWRSVVAELEGLAAERQLKPGHEAFQGIEYLRIHGESDHLQYLMCKRKRITRGSGAIESTIRRVINLRMKGNGIFWKEENAEAFMQMRASLLSEQWESEMEVVRKRAQTGSYSKDYRWKAEDMLHGVKLEDEEGEELLNKPKISADQSNAA